MKKGFMISLSSLCLLMSPLMVLTSCNEGDSTVDIEAMQTNVTWNKPSVLTISQGATLTDEFLTSGVTATGENGEKLTVKVETNNVNTEVARSYTITLRAYNGEVAIDNEHNGTLQRRLVVQAGAYISNGSFNNGVVNDLKTWVNGQTGANITYRGVTSDDSDPSSTTKGCLQVNVTNPGQYWYDNQLEFQGLVTKAHTTYLVEFDAKSDTERNIGVTLEMKEDPYTYVDTCSTNGWSQKTSKEWQHFKFPVTSTEDFQNVKLALVFGYYNDDDAGESTVWIDNIKITALEKEANTTGVTFHNRIVDYPQIANVLSLYNPELAEAVSTYQNQDYWIFTNELLSTIGQITGSEGIPELTAEDATGNELEVHTLGVTKTPSFTTSDRLWSVFYYTLDSDNNLSYCVRKFDYRVDIPVSL